MPAQFELVAAGEDKASGRWIPVDFNLNPGQQLGNPLDFIDDGPSGKPCQKPARIRPGKLACIGLLQVGIGQFRECLAAKRGFPGLARARHCHYRQLLRPRLKDGKEMSPEHDGDYCKNEVPVQYCIHKRMGPARSLLSTGHQST